MNPEHIPELDTPDALDIVKIYMHLFATSSDDDSEGNAKTAICCALYHIRKGNVKDALLCLNDAKHYINDKIGGVD